MFEQSQHIHRFNDLQWGGWQIIKAGYFDKDDNYIDITGPYAGGKILEARRLVVPMRLSFNMRTLWIR